MYDPFFDRRDAGKQLAAALARRRDLRDAVVIGLPRGGVPVAAEVARALGAPLDVLVVRKLGAPMQPELGIGAIAEGDFLSVDDALQAALGVTNDELARIAAREREVVERRVQQFRRGRALEPVAQRATIVVDDGIATGGTMRAALRALRARHPRKLIVAVPVAARDTLEDLAAECDEIVCLRQPVLLHAVGAWYQDFTQVESEEVAAALEQARGRDVDTA